MWVILQAASTPINEALTPYLLAKTQRLQESNEVKAVSKDRVLKGTAPKQKLDGPYNNAVTVRHGSTSSASD